MRAHFNQLKKVKYSFLQNIQALQSGLKNELV
jgi:hypothetical protein